eukprot:4526639-Pyramimonas_sp.AAC.2
MALHLDATSLLLTERCKSPPARPPGARGPMKNCSPAAPRRRGGPSCLAGRLPIGGGVDSGWPGGKGGGGRRRQLSTAVDPAVLEPELPDGRDPVETAHQRERPEHIPQSLLIGGLGVAHAELLPAGPLGRRLRAGPETEKSLLEVLPLHGGRQDEGAYPELACWGDHPENRQRAAQQREFETAVGGARGNVARGHPPVLQGLRGAHERDPHLPGLVSAEVVHAEERIVLPRGRRTVLRDGGGEIAEVLLVENRGAEEVLLVQLDLGQVNALVGNSRVAAHCSEGGSGPC